MNYEKYSYTDIAELQSAFDSIKRVLDSFDGEDCMTRDFHELACAMDNIGRVICYGEDEAIEVWKKMSETKSDSRKASYAVCVLMDLQFDCEGNPDDYLHRNFVDLVAESDDGFSYTYIEPY